MNIKIRLILDLGMKFFNLAVDVLEVIIDTLLNVSCLLTQVIV